MRAYNMGCLKTEIDKIYPSAVRLTNSSKIVLACCVCAASILFVLSLLLLLCF